MIIIMSAVAISANACKEMEIGLNDDAQSTLDCLSQRECESSSSSSTDNNDENDSENDASSEGGSSGTSSSEDSSTSSGSGANDPSDSSGGVGFMPVSSKGGPDRYFMGTYSLQSYYSNGYDSCTSDYGNAYDFPATVRAYSHNNDIDYEDSTGNLVWQAQVYPDDTFDFHVQLLDSFGKPSNTVSCTCDLSIPYYNGKERMSCVCDPTYSGDEQCALTYDLL